MSAKHTTKINAPELAGTLPIATPKFNQLAQVPPQAMVSVPAPLSTPVTVWGAKRQAKFLRALADQSNAQTEYYRSIAETAKGFVTAARAMNEVAELPEICADDTEIRRLYREADVVDAQTRLQQAKYAYHMTRNEVNKALEPQLKKVKRSNAAAIDALLKHKVDLEAMGEDTTQLEQTIASLQRG